MPGGFVEKRDDFFIPEEVAEWIGLKKSQYLSKIIEMGKPDDIGFEQYHLFDQHIPGTIENPDKAFESEDEDQKIRTYVRSYRTEVEFHQVVVGMVMDDKEMKASVFIPIISFVSKNDELIKEFCVGEVISRPTLN